jgi:hypothetical protein
MTLAVLGIGTVSARRGLARAAIAKIADRMK